MLLLYMCETRMQLWYTTYLYSFRRIHCPPCRDGIHWHLWSCWFDLRYPQQLAKYKGKTQLVLIVCKGSMYQSQHNTWSGANRHSSSTTNLYACRPRLTLWIYVKSFPLRCIGIYNNKLQNKISDTNAYNRWQYDNHDTHTQ
jgi:hypothetical protein